MTSTDLELALISWVTWAKGMGVPVTVTEGVIRIGKAPMNELVMARLGAIFQEHGQGDKWVKRVRA